MFPIFLFFFFFLIFSLFLCSINFFIFVSSYNLFISLYKHWTQPTFYCPLPTVPNAHYRCDAAHCPMSTVHCPLNPNIHHGQMFTMAHCPPQPTANCTLSTAHCPLHTVHCTLSMAHCPLPFPPPHICYDRHFKAGTRENYRNENY